MKSSRSAPVPMKPLAQSVPTARGSWVRFWFTPADPISLHVVRVLAGLLFLVWLLPFANNLDSLFGLQGWFDQKAYSEMARWQQEAEQGLRPDAPPLPIGWSALYLGGSDAQILTAAYWLSVSVLVLFTVGLWTRLTSVLTWVVVASFTLNPAIEYEGDTLLRLIAFYLMVGYVLLGQRDSEQSLLARLFGSVTTLLLGRGPGARPSLGANLALRLLQVHFAVVLVVSGLHMLQHGEWWSGTALWYPIYPPFETTLADARAQRPHTESFLFVLSLATYAILIWRLGFPLFAWRPRWRVVLVGGAIVGWVGNALLWQLPLMGPALLIGCLSFVTAEEWHRFFGLLARLPGLQWLARWLPIDLPGEAMLPGIRKDDAALPLRSDARMAKSETIMSRHRGA